MGVIAHWSKTLILTCPWHTNSHPSRAALKITWEVHDLRAWLVVASHGNPPRRTLRQGCLITQINTLPRSLCPRLRVSIKKFPRKAWLTFYITSISSIGHSWICKRWSRWWFQIFFYFRPYLGRWSNLTNIFQMGWFNHQPVILCTSMVKLPLGGIFSCHYGLRKSRSSQRWIFNKDVGRWYVSEIPNLFQLEIVLGYITMAFIIINLSMWEIWYISSNFSHVHTQIQGISGTSAPRVHHLKPPFFRLNLQGWWCG